MEAASKRLSERINTQHSKLKIPAPHTEHILQFCTEQMKQCKLSNTCFEFTVNSGKKVDLIQVWFFLPLFCRFRECVFNSMLPVSVCACMRLKRFL